MRGSNLLTAAWKRLPRSARRDWIYAIVRVDDPSGRIKHYWFARDTVIRGVSVGTDRKCDIRLTGAGVRPLHAILQPMSNHWMLRHVPQGRRLPLPDWCEDQNDDRVDRAPFEIEDHTLLIDDY